MGPYRGPLWGPYGPIYRPLEGALLRYPSGLLRGLQAIFYVTQYRPYRGVGGPLWAYTRDVGEFTSRKGTWRYLIKGPIWTPKGTPIWALLLSFLGAFRLSTIFLLNDIK